MPGEGTWGGGSEQHCLRLGARAHPQRFVLRGDWEGHRQTVVS